MEIEIFSKLLIILITRLAYSYYINYLNTNRTCIVFKYVKILCILMHRGLDADRRLD